MKRRIGLLAAAALVAGLAFVAQPPASAVEACAGLGDASLGAGIGVPNPTVAPTSTTFAFNLNTGVCAPTLGTLSASGTMRGYCGQSGGQGTTNTGLVFSYTSAGTILAVSGQVVGVVNAAEDPLDTGSCANGTATHFLVNGGGVGNGSVVACPLVESLNQATNLTVHVKVCI